MSGRRDERGAVAVVAAAAVALMVAMAAFAVDLGMQRVVRSDIQALVDIVSLDAARLLDGRTALQIENGDATHDPLDEVVAASQAANDDTLGSVVTLEVTLVDMTTNTLGERVPVTNSSGDPIAVAANVVPDAVFVRATGEVDFAFAPGSGRATRDALANA